MDKKIGSELNNQKQVKNGKTLGEIINNLPLIKEIRKASAKLVGDYEFAPAIINAIKGKDGISESISVNSVMTAAEEDFIKRNLLKTINGAIEADVNKNIPGLIISKGQIDISASIEEQKRLGINPEEIGGIFAGKTIQKQEKIPLEEKTKIVDKELENGGIKKQSLGGGRVKITFDAKDINLYPGYYNKDAIDRLINQCRERNHAPKAMRGPIQGVKSATISKVQKSQVVSIEKLEENQKKGISLEDIAKIGVVLEKINAEEIDSTIKDKIFEEFGNMNNPVMDMVRFKWQYEQLSPKDQEKLRHQNPELVDGILYEFSSKGKHKEELESIMSAYDGYMCKMMYDELAAKLPLYESEEEILAALDAMGKLMAKAAMSLEKFPDLCGNMLKTAVDIDADLVARGYRKKSLVSVGKDGKTTIDISEPSKGDAIIAQEAQEFSKKGIKFNIKSISKNGQKDKSSKRVEKRAKQRASNFSMEDVEKDFFDKNHIEAAIDGFRNFNGARTSDDYYRRLQEYIFYTGRFPKSVFRDPVALQNSNIKKMAAEFQSNGTEKTQAYADVYAKIKTEVIENRYAEYAIEKIDIHGVDGLTDEGLKKCIKYMIPALADGSLSDYHKKRAIEVLRKINPSLVNESGQIEGEEITRLYKQLNHGDRDYFDLESKKTGEQELTDFYKKMNQEDSYYLPDDLGELSEIIKREMISRFTSRELKRKAQKEEIGDLFLTDVVGEDLVNKLFKKETQEITIIKDKEEIFDEERANMVVLMTNPVIEPKKPELKPVSTQATILSDEYIRRRLEGKDYTGDISIKGQKPLFTLGGAAAKRAEEAKRRREETEQALAEESGKKGNFWESLKQKVDVKKAVEETEESKKGKGKTQGKKNVDERSE